MHEKNRHVGRVQLAYRLHDDRVVLASDVVTVEEPVEKDDIQAVVVAIGAAMTSAASRVAADVAAHVR